MEKAIGNYQPELVQALESALSQTKPQNRPIGLSGVEAARIRRSMRRTPRSGR